MKLNNHSNRDHNDTILELITRTEKYSDVTEVGEVSSQWSTETLSKSYYQRIQLVADFIFITLRAENPQYRFNGSHQPFSSDSIQYADFLYLNKIIDLLSLSILSSANPPQASETMSKVLSELVPLTKDLVGLGQEDLTSLVRAFAVFRIKRPHDWHLTQLAKTLFNDSSYPAKLRLISAKYHQESIHGDPTPGHLVQITLASLMQTLKAQQAKRFVIKKPNATADYFTKSLQTFKSNVPIANNLNSRPKVHGGGFRCSKIFQ